MLLRQQTTEINLANSQCRQHGDAAGIGEQSAVIQLILWLLALGERRNFELNFAEQRIAVWLSAANRYP